MSLQLQLAVTSTCCQWSKHKHMTNYSSAQLLPVLFDHACNHAIDEWYQFMVQCLHAQNLLRVFQYKIWDHYCWSPHAIDHCISSVCPQCRCTTIVSLCMLHLSSIYNTCYRMLMFGNCDCDHHDCSSWHFWHIVQDSSTLSIMVQYLWIYSLSVIWRYYMKVMFIFSMPTRITANHNQFSTNIIIISTAFYNTGYYWMIGW